METGSCRCISIYVGSALRFGYKLGAHLDRTEFGSQSPERADRRGVAKHIARPHALTRGKPPRSSSISIEQEVAATMLSSLHQRWHDHTERAHIDFTPLRSVLRILVAESKAKDAGSQTCSLCTADHSFRTSTVATSQD